MILLLNNKRGNFNFAFGFLLKFYTEVVMNKLKLFGKRIRELRKKSGFTQEQLSEKIG